MALGYTERELRKTGQPEDLALAEVVEGILKARGERDIPLPDSSSSTSKEQVISLGQATKEYKGDVANPEKVTAFWQAFWAENGKKVGISISVPECPFTPEQLEEMRKKDKGPIYVSEDLSTQRGRHLLGKMFPKMQSPSVVEENDVTNEVQSFGWRSFDTSVDAPHQDTDENQLKEAIVRNGEEEPTLNEYIVAGQASKLLTGRYLDEGTTASRILGSRRGGRVVRAYFGSYGYLHVYSHLGPGSRLPYWGGRGSSGVN